MGFWDDILGDGDVGARVAAPADARALLAKVDAEVARLDGAVTASDVRRVFKRAWRQFVGSWREFFQEEAAGPHPYAHRQALSYLAQAQDWRRAFERERRARASGEVASTGGWAIFPPDDDPWGGLLRDDDDLGALIITPAMSKAEMETVDAGTKQLDSDIMASKVREPFKKAWRLFVDEWQRFYKANAGWWARGWAGTYEKTVEFRKRVDEWRQAFMREGGQATGPTLVVPETGGGSWKPILIAVGGLLVVGAVVGRAVK